MRYIYGFICVMALGVMGCSETAGTGGSGGAAGTGGNGGGTGGADDGGAGSFVVAADGQSWVFLVGTTVELTDEGSLLALRARNFYDPVPDGEFDEVSFSFEVAFDKDALAALATEQEHVISGQASWDPPDRVRELSLDDVVFTGDGSHTPAVDRALFVTGHPWPCYPKQVGSQILRGTLRLYTNTTAGLAGIIDLRVEGDVPGECTDLNFYDSYDLTLTFDVHRSL